MSSRTYDQVQLSPTETVTVPTGGTVVSLVVPRSGDYHFDYFLDGTTDVPLSAELTVDGVSVPGTARTAPTSSGAQQVIGAGLALNLERGQTLALVNLSSSPVDVNPSAIPGAPAASLSIERLGKSSSSSCGG